MIKTDWKKAIIAASILTVLGAGAAFAADDTENMPPKPSMRERVEAILHGDDEKGAPPRGPRHRDDRRGGPRDGRPDKGQRFDGGRGPRNDMHRPDRPADCDGPFDNCIGPRGPHFDDRRNPADYDGPQAPGHHFEGGPGRHHRGGPRLSPEEMQEREARRAEWEKMTPEQRQEAHKKWIEERKANMSEEEKARFEEREARFEKMREEREKAREAQLNKLTDEQRAEVEEFIKADKQYRDEMRARLEKMTPEQRDALRPPRPQGPEPRREGPHRPPMPPRGERPDRPERPAE